jgi:NitT/TauT family transport system permease protein/sulfonate transport system permease protein
VAWKIALVAELMGSTSGLGFLMLRAQGSADITTVVAACLAIVLLFYAGEKLLIDPLARRFAAK